jgi:hypothetical protein
VNREGRSSQDLQLLLSDLIYAPKTAIPQMNLFAEQYIRRMLPITRSFGFSVRKT